MLGKPARVVFALTAVAPISISLSYVLIKNNRDWVLALIALASCILLGALCRVIIKYSSKNFEVLPVVIKKAKSADKEVLGFFIAYALPLIFKGQEPPEMGAWMLAGGMLLFVLWTTHAIQVNPVLGLLGYHYYEVETQEGITYLMISKRAINDVSKIKKVVQLTEYGIIECNEG
ncbi:MULTISPECIES: hypothetical protein [unclassified Pseudomonas]|uniref:hypothetical protein n=1 Tax=unclassified Pseudomonas TaxID=196821 RepID=UPI00235DD74C|nr:MULTISPECIES: hypothetical protein [unclassified Pseudomonas]